MNSNICTVKQHAALSIACQIIRSCSTMLVMSASRSQAYIYDLLAVRILLTRGHEVKAIKVTSPSETTQHLSSSFTPSVAAFPQTSLPLPELTFL